MEVYKIQLFIQREHDKTATELNCVQIAESSSEAIDTAVAWAKTIYGPKFRYVASWRQE